MYDNFDVKDSSDPLFNVIAGTSSGAMNAAILISHVVHNNNKWKGSVEKLNSFWDYVSVGFDIESLIPGFKEWWKAWHNLHYNTATEEVPEDTFQYCNSYLVEYKTSTPLHHTYDLMTSSLILSIVGCSIANNR